MFTRVLYEVNKQDETELCSGVYNIRDVYLEDSGFKSWSQNNSSLQEYVVFDLFRQISG